MGKPKEEKKGRKRLIKFIWAFFLISMTSFFILIMMINAGWLGYMPSMKELENPKSAISSEVYANNGEIIGRYFVQDRSTSDYKEISQNVFNALIATEDARFYEHSGVDGIAIIRAVAKMGKAGGGSTISQQLAKNLFKRKYTSKLMIPFVKLKEWVMAVKLEKNLTKDEIITLYLNTVPFGGNVYGIRNASLTFFNKTPDQLSVEEAAVLVGMLRANTYYNPQRNPENALRRRNVVIGQMEKYGYLTAAEADKYQKKPLVLDYKKVSYHEGLAPYFRQVVEQQVKDVCKTLTKPNGEHYDIYRDGLKIYTTLDVTMQQYAEAAVQKHLDEMQQLFMDQPGYNNGKVWDKFQTYLLAAVKASERYKDMKQEGLSHDKIMKEMKKPVKMTVYTWKNKSHEVDTVMSPIDSIMYTKMILQAGFMALDPATGEVRAWVGGTNHEYFQYDHVNINTKRQVGSTIKPLLYCLAVDNGFSPCGMVSTSPQDFPTIKGYDAGGSKKGDITMKEALAKSINNAALYLIKQVSISSFADFIHQCGISSQIDKVPSLALGVPDISLYEMLWAYTMFPNEGLNIQPIYITRIEDKNGSLLKSFVPVQKELINPTTAYKMVKMMQGVVDFGTAVRLRYKYKVEGDIAGKTGTTNNQADAWFIGYTPQILAGAWVGCDDRYLRFQRTSLGQGASAALPIWAYFMKSLQSDPKTGIRPDVKFNIPDNFSDCQVLVDSTSMLDGYGTGETNEVPPAIPPSEWE